MAQLLQRRKTPHDSSQPEPLSDGGVDKLIKLFVLLAVKSEAAELAMAWSEDPERLARLMDSLDKPDVDSSGARAGGGWVAFTNHHDGSSRFIACPPPEVWPAVRDRLAELAQAKLEESGTSVGSLTFQIADREVPFELDWETDERGELLVLVRTEGWP